MDLVHSQVPETNTGRPQHRGQESNLRPSGSEPDATTSSCYPGMLFSITEHGWKELNLHTTASKAAGLPLADTRMLCKTRVPCRSRTDLTGLEAQHLCRSVNGTYKSSGGRNRTCVVTINSRPPVPAQDPPNCSSQDGRI